MRKVQNPAKVCAIGDATKFVSAFRRGRRGELSRFMWADSGALQKLVVNALDLRANMPPVEVGQDRGSRVGAQLGCEFSIIQ